MKNYTLLGLAALLMLALASFAFQFDASSVLLAAPVAAAPMEEVVGEVKRIVKEVNDWTDRHNKTAGEIDSRLSSVEQVVTSLKKGAGPRVFETRESIGKVLAKQFEENSAFKHLAERNAGTCRISVEHELKGLIVGDGFGASSDVSTYPVAPDRGGVYGPVLRPLRLLDALPMRPTGSDSVEYVQIGATGEASEQVNQGDEKAEADFEGTLVTANIATIAQHTTASTQVLTDAAALTQTINRVLMHKCMARLEHQLINGPGGQGKIKGLLELSAVWNAFQSSDNEADMIARAITDMENDGYAPNLIVMNPLNWIAIQLLKDGEDRYLFGDPTRPAPPSLWNRPVITTPSIAQTNILVLDTSYVTVLDRMKPTVMVSNQHKDYFTRNLVSILGELRAGLEVGDVAAVTNIDLS